MAPQKTDFTPHLRKLCIHVLGKNFYKLLFWMGDTNKSHLFGRFICRSRCHSIFHPEIDSKYGITWTQEVTEHGEITHDFSIFFVGCRSFPSFLPVTMWQNFLKNKHMEDLQGVNSWRKCHVFDINLWWTLSKSRSPWTPGYKPATIGRNQCVMNRMVAALLRLLTARLPLLIIVRPIISVGIRPLANDVAKARKQPPSANYKTKSVLWKTFPCLT